MTKPNTRIPSSASIRPTEPNSDIASRKRQSRKDEVKFLFSFIYIYIYKQIPFGQPKKKKEVLLLLLLFSQKK